MGNKIPSYFTEVTEYDFDPVFRADTISINHGGIEWRADTNGKFIPPTGISFLPESQKILTKICD